MSRVSLAGSPDSGDGLTLPMRGARKLCRMARRSAYALRELQLMTAKVLEEHFGARDGACMTDFQWLQVTADGYASAQPSAGYGAPR